MILISSLPDEYNNLITTLETLKEDRLTWDYVRDRVITEFDRGKGDDEKNENNKGPQDALFVGGGSGNKKKFWNKIPGLDLINEILDILDKIDTDKKKDGEGEGGNQPG